MMWPAALCAAGDFLGPGVKALADTQKGGLSFHPFKSTAPYDYHVPSVVLPRLFVSDVALDVLGPFLHPEFHVALRHR